MYKAGWYELSAARVTALVNFDFNFHVPIYLTDSQIDATLDAVPAFQPVCVLLSGDDTEKIRQIARLADHPKVTGFLIDDESNLAGMSITTQQSRYVASKYLAPAKAVFGSYNLNLNSSACMANHQSVGCWDYVFTNRYDLRYGISDEAAAATLAAVLAAARRFFASGCNIIPVEQCAGNTTAVTGDLRPIEGLLQSQHDLWNAASMNPLNAIVLYGDATISSENDNLSTNTALLNEASEVS